jgi:hypothetical protein
MIYERQSPQLIKAYLDACVSAQHAVQRRHTRAGLLNFVKRHGHVSRIRK